MMDTLETPLFNYIKLQLNASERARPVDHTFEEPVKNLSEEAQSELISWSRNISLQNGVPQDSHSTFLSDVEKRLPDLSQIELNFESRRCDLMETDNASVETRKSKVPSIIPILITLVN